MIAAIKGKIYKSSIKSFYSLFDFYNSPEQNSQNFRKKKKKKKVDLKNGFL